MTKTKYWLAGLLFLALVIAGDAAFAAIYPENDSRIKYFYVFGPQGDQDLGAEADHGMIFYIDLPEEAAQDLTVDIYDPDTSDRIDYRGNFGQTWNTLTDFKVYGKDGALLENRRFGEKEYDGKYFRFGPFLKSQGEKIGGGYRFSLEINALQGSNANLFKIRVTPDSAQMFTYKAAFRLLEAENEKMYFYPEVKSGMSKISVENYDMDVDGARGSLCDPLTGKCTAAKDSLSAKWAKTDVAIADAQTRRLEYVMTKKTQRHGHAAVQFKDAAGNFLPIYFQKDKPEPGILPEAKVSGADCRILTFDATESYDPNNRKLAYLWDFGDGTTSNEPVVKHEFAKGGEYKVALTVKNTSGLDCDTAVTSEVVSINSAPQAAFVSPEFACVNQGVVFDAGTTEDDTPGQLSFRWDFGDKTKGESKKLTKAYRESGLYKVVLTVDDHAGTSCSVSSAVKYIGINSVPYAGVYEDIDLCLPLDQQYNVAFDFAEKDIRGRGNLKYTWDFGDGTGATGKNVTHVYKKGGEYRATLSVDDGLGLACSTGKASFTVNLSKQPQAKAGNDIVACLGDAVVFDGTHSRGEDESKLTYIWDFGDGTPIARGAKVSHLYARPGIYKATLTVLDGRSRKCSIASDTLSVLVNTKPSFTIREVPKACIGKSVDFSAFLNSSSEGNPDKHPLRYTWDFGDGVVAEGSSSISHTYQKGGEYLVQATARDRLNTPCSQDTQSIKVKVNTPPKADTGPNLVCCANSKSIFDGSFSSDPDKDRLTYAWNFGDGSSSKDARAEHIYKRRGKYKVTLEVNDGSGTPCSSSIAATEVDVSEKPVSVIKVR